MEHLTRGEIETFVAGSPGADADRVRRHLSGCRRCSERMAREARLELALLETGAAGPVGMGGGPRAPRFRVSWAVAVGALVVLIAAAFVLRLGGGNEDPGTVGAVYTAALRPGLTCDPADTMTEVPGYTVVCPRDAGRKVTVPDTDPWRP